MVKKMAFFCKKTVSKSFKCICEMVMDFLKKKNLFIISVIVKI